MVGRQELQIICVFGMNPINYQSDVIDVVPVVLFESVDKRLNTDSPAVDVLIIFSYLSCISVITQANIGSVVDIINMMNRLSGSLYLIMLLIL